MIASVRAKLFSAAALWSAPDDWRPDLIAVHIHPHPKGGAVIAATDGHRIIVIHDETGACKKPVSVRLPKGGLKLAANAPEGAQITVDGIGVATVGGEAFANTVPTKTFPDYRRALGHIVAAIGDKKSGRATFNTRYIADIHKMSQALGVSAPDGVRLVTFSGEDPALILWPRAAHAFGALMPLRSDDVNALPAWMKPVMSAAQTKIVAAKPLKKAA